MTDVFETPQFFERSGTDPGIEVDSALPDPGARPPSSSLSGEPEGMTLVEHITELRNRILLSVLVLLVGVGLGFVYALDVINLFKSMAPATILFVQLSPGEVLMASVRVAVAVGFTVAAPVILYNLLQFVLPGLRGRERVMLTWAVTGGSLLFAAGMAFAYFWVVPPALSFLVDYGQSVAQVQLGIDRYIAFCVSLLLVTGGMFELPMVLFLLSFTGLITSQKLMREWRWATVLIFIVAAIVTPGQDPLSMALVGSAMVGLYAFSIIPIKLCGR